MVLVIPLILMHSLSAMESVFNDHSSQDDGKFEVIVINDQQATNIPSQVTNNGNNQVIAPLAAAPINTIQSLHQEVKRAMLVALISFVTGGLCGFAVKTQLIPCDS